MSASEHLNPAQFGEDYLNDPRYTEGRVKSKMKALGGGSGKPGKKLVKIDTEHWPNVAVRHGYGAPN